MQIAKLKTLQKHNLGIDLMGGDLSPHELMDAIVVFLLQKERLPHITFFALHELSLRVEELCNRFPPLRKRISFVGAEDVITMNDNPLHAIRRKQDSSLCVGMRHLKQKKLDAFITCGNTGALIAAARRYLPLFPNVSRPALLALLPTNRSAMAVLDVGANVSNKAEDLIQFAKLGSAFQKTHGIAKPRVGLLNIGTEALKGTSEIKKAYQILESEKFSQFTFIGNIEGKEAFEGSVDVLVTDGFTGNVFLKTSEGIANLVLERIKENLSSLSLVFPDMKKHLDYAEYPGALVMGIDAMVIKCHGYASSQAMTNAIEGASQMLEAAFIKNIRTIATSI